MLSRVVVVGNFSEPPQMQTPMDQNQVVQNKNTDGRRERFRSIGCRLRVSGYRDVNTPSKSRNSDTRDLGEKDEK